MDSLAELGKRVNSEGGFSRTVLWEIMLIRVSVLRIGNKNSVVKACLAAKERTLVLSNCLVRLTY